jgi:hypothetical protein
MRTYSGLVQIEGAEFWGWIQHRIKNTDTIFSTPEFMMEDVVLTAVNDSSKKFYVPSEDFWSWVIENYMPCPSDECDCNKPVWNVENQTLDIEFAGGSLHPSQWAVKPAWLNK